MWKQALAIGAVGGFVARRYYFHKGWRELRALHSEPTVENAMAAFTELSKGATSVSAARFRKEIKRVEGDLKGRLFTHIAERVNPNDVERVIPLVPDSLFSYRESTQSFRDRSTEVATNFLGSFTRTFVRAYNYNEEGPDPIDRWDATRRMADLFELIGVPYLVLSFAFSGIQQLTGRRWLATLGTASAAVGGIQLIRWHALHSDRCPRSIGSFENWTKIANSLPDAVGRDDEIEFVIEHLNGLGTDEKPLLLLGKTGCGKSAIVKGLAKKIAANEIPELEGVQLFYVNTADLKDHGGESSGRYRSRLEMIRNDLQGHRRAILFLDEVHTAGTNVGSGEHGTDLPWLLQTLFDKEGINVIAATTPGEYKEYLSSNKALKRRWQFMHLQSLPDNHIVDLLAKRVASDYPGVEISRENLQHLLEKSGEIRKDIGQPDLAIGLLRRIAKRSLRGTEPSPRLEAWRRKYAQLAHGQPSRALAFVQRGILPALEKRSPVKITQPLINEVAAKQKADLEKLT